ncbi:HAD-IIIC family phosphatase [Streptomyces qinglanensis]|uniref:HAD-superfamily phosphatase, subfamily IIIC/FkbH-like domain-containing protein n=1 Tax=Streptomyces qinglanensis TaxID=943816 RepID=A0A1H9NCB1_9ACTN|nr:HAD-IIIC family phosphatase [Streptomyces qinglanensis]SER33013.1 HAD-superfamily phosphatase, subfamily IIIC/FkbH-like domain-containing protein [Streptomyces qinglanensis]
MPDRDPAPAPGAALRTLHARGRLAAEYPAVRELLAAADRDTLDFAGRVLAPLDPEEVLAHHPDTPVVRVAVTGRGTVGELVPALTAQLARHGILARTRVCGSGGYLGDLADPNSPLYAHRPEVTLCVLDPLTVWDTVEVPWQPLEVSVAAERRRKVLGELAQLHAASAPRGATLVLNTVPLLRRFTHQLTSLAQRAELGGLWKQFNADLLHMARPSAGLAVLDLEPVTSAGVRADEPRLGTYAEAHCTADLLTHYAREAAHLIRGLRGEAKKCLVLDLDGTLWDGVLAEDGPEGVTAAGTLRGAAFGAFQLTVKQLAAQGVLLAVCSRNDAEAVRRALAEHPEFPLRPDDFATVVAGWGSKAEGVRTVAERLGLAPEAVVFADDTPFERESVRAGVPGAAVVELDAEPALHTERLLADGWFDTPALTDEDRLRPVRYARRAARVSSEAASADHRAFLATLELRVEISPAREHELARLAQLTLRTNRFNLTGQRLSAEQVRQRAAAPGAAVLAVRAADRFGDEGVVGAVLARIDGNRLRVENLLLSCRVLGRGVEEAVLAGLLAAAREAGLTAVHAVWRPTRANAAVRTLCPRHGFRTVTGPGAGPKAPPGSGTAAGPAAGARAGSDREDGAETGVQTGRGTGAATGAESRAPGEVRFEHPLRTLPPVPGHITLRLRLTGEPAQPTADGTEVGACAPSRS